MRTFVLLIILFTLSSCSSTPEAKDRGTASNKAALYESDDSNCGAEGYACVGGRTCSDSRCLPAWIEMDETSAPTARAVAGAGFVNEKYIVFGGCTSISGVSAEASGGSYDPTMDVWSTLPTLNEGRAQFATVTTDFGVYAFGGISTCFNGTAEGPGFEALFDIYNPWTNLPASGVPSARYGTSLTWNKSSVASDGSGLFVYGGADAVNSSLATGGSLDLGENWRGITSPLADGARSNTFSTFFNKGILHVWGDGDDGLLYDTKNGSWFDWSLPSGTPDFDAIQTYAGTNARFADTGDKILVISSNNDVLIYDKESQSWMTDTQDVPMGFCAEGATAWTGTEMITWSGVCGGTISTVGARYQPPAP